MGNWTFLKGCRSLDDAVSIATGPTDLWETHDPETGPTYAAKYCVPLFWLAGFSASDVAMIQLPFRDMDDNEFSEDLAMLCAPASEIAERLARRRDALLTVVDPDYALLFDRWRSVVQSRFPHSIMIEASDVFTMNGIAEGSAAVRTCVEALDGADRGEPLVLSEAFTLIGATDPSSNTVWNDFDPAGLVVNWMSGLVGAPSDGDEDYWLPDPTPAQLRLAKERIATRKSVSDFYRPNRPWWAFWRR